jgi:transaldolase
VVFDASKLSVKIFADGADFDGMVEMAAQKHIAGFTTNPTLMRKSGVSDYERFAKLVLREISNKSVSFEVFTDDLDEMYVQGLKIAQWAENVFVKIPITNTKGESTAQVISKLTERGVKVNVTAIMTLPQVEQILPALNPTVQSYVSIFAGRIADTGLDPMPTIRNGVETISRNPQCELIWASPRELLNIFQADSCGCHIITASNDLLHKLSLVGKNLDAYSLETVQMFQRDAEAAGFHI